MTYSLTAASSVVRDADGAVIPDDPANADWQVYQEWLAAGNVPTPYVAPIVPLLLNYLQFRALFTASENQAIMTAAQGNHAVLDWLFQAAGAGQIDMSNPLVSSGLTALVNAGLITAARETQILAGQIPS